MAKLIGDGEAVGLDSGTPLVEVARVLAGLRMTVMPMSLHALMALAASASVRLMMPGGETRAEELAMVGALAVASIAALRFGTVVLRCCGISPEGQLTAHDLGDAAVKQVLLASARRRVLVLEGTKFTHAAMAVVCQLSAFDVVVTDSTAPDSVVGEFAVAGVVVRRV